MRIEKKLLFICLFISYLQIGISQSHGIEKNDAQASKNVLGEWHQLAYRDEQWETLAIFRLDIKQGVYLMTRIDKGASVPIFKPKPKGVSDIRFKGDEWYFKSDWGQGKIADFRLKQITSGLYVGWSYLNGKKVEQYIWLRSKSNQEN
jgi:hypothetical protein